MPILIRQRLFPILVILCAFTAGGKAQNAVTSEGFKPDYFWLVDSTASRSLSEIQQLRFFPLTSDTLPLHSGRALWLRFHWDGDSGNETGPFYMVFKENVSSIESWQLTRQDTLHYRGGFQLNYADRAFKPDKYTLPLTKEPAEVYIRIWVLDRKGNYPFFIKTKSCRKRRNYMTDLKLNSISAAFTRSITYCLVWHFFWPYMPFSLLARPR